MSFPGCLVADIGGTHARFAMLDECTAVGGRPVLKLHAKFKCRDFGSLEQALNAYLDLVDVQELRFACISIAGPVDSDLVRMTNLDWEFSIRRLQESFQLEDLLVINDAAAGALSTTILDDSDLALVNAGSPEPWGVRLNLVPGTGFGAAGTVSINEAWYPIPGEGGHASLAPVGAEEFEVLRQIEIDQGRATPDLVLSGPGMLSLYKALAAVRDVVPMDLDPVTLTRMAMQGTDQLCRDTLSLYCALLAGLASDLALTFTAKGGVFLSGSLLNRLGEDMLRDSFLERFSNKGSMSARVADVPVFLVKRDFPGLLGAAVWLCSRVSQVAGEKTRPRELVTKVN